LSAKRKKNRAEVIPEQGGRYEVLEEKLNWIEQYLQGCRALMAGESPQVKKGMLLRALFEIEDAARIVRPKPEASIKQRTDEQFGLLREAGWY
jgi:hypothetical protein